MKQPLRPSRVLCTALLACALALVLPATAPAQIAGPAFDTTAGTRHIGLGRSFTAIVDDPSAIRINPAGIGQAKAVQAGVRYQRNVDEFNQHTISFVDSQTSPLAVGVSWTVVNDNALGVIGADYGDDAEWPYQMVSIALADTTLKSFILGITGHWLRTDQPASMEAHHVFDMTAAAMIPLKELMGLQVAVVGRNLIGDDPSFLPREFEVAGAFVPLEWLRGVGKFQWEWSGNDNDERGAGFGFGAEVEPKKDWRLRAGGHRDATTGDWFIGAGTGLEGKEGGISYAYERNFSLETNQHTIELYLRWF